MPRLFYPRFQYRNKKRPTRQYINDDNQVKPEPESSLRERDGSYIDTGPCGAPALLCDKPDDDGDDDDSELVMIALIMTMTIQGVRKKETNRQIS